MDVAGELVLWACVEKSARAGMPACGGSRLLKRGERVGDDRAVGVGMACDRLVQELREPSPGCVGGIERVVVDDDEAPVAEMKPAVVSPGQDAFVGVIPSACPTYSGKPMKLSGFRYSKPA